MTRMQRASLALTLLMVFLWYGILASRTYAPAWFAVALLVTLIAAVTVVMVLVQAWREQ